MTAKIIRCLVLLEGTPPEPDSSKYWEHLAQVMRGFGIEPKTDLAPSNDFHHKWLIGTASGARELHSLAEEHFGDGIWDNATYDVKFRRFQNASLGNGWFLVVNRLSDAPSEPVDCKACGRRIVLNIKGDGIAKSVCCVRMWKCLLRYLFARVRCVGVWSLVHCQYPRRSLAGSEMLVPLTHSCSKTTQGCWSPHQLASPQQLQRTQDRLSFLTFR